MPDDVSLPDRRPSNRDLQTMPLTEALEVYMPSLAEALPDHIPLQRFKRVLLTAVNLNPDLRHADRRSLFNACVKAAHDGLYPDGREAALVVFETNVKTTNERGMDVWVKVPVASYFPMIAGIRKRMRNSGEVVAAIAEVVYRNDKFRVIKGIDGRIEHEPPALDQERGDAVGAYAQIKLRTGEIIQEVMTKREIEHIRDTFSRGAANAKSPWRTSEGEMWRKTVLRRCSKSAPGDADLDRVLDRDDEPLDEPHPMSFPPPRPTRDQFTDERQEQLEALAGIEDPAESAEPSEQKGEPHRPESYQGDSPQEPRRRRRRTKAEMEAARQTAEHLSSGYHDRVEQDAHIARVEAEGAKSYAVVDPDGEVHEFDIAPTAAYFLVNLFTTARTFAALKALHEDNLDLIRALPDTSKELSDLREIFAAKQQSELATATPATTKLPDGTGAAPEPDRQGVPLAAPPPPGRSEGDTTPTTAAPPPLSLAIEPVYDKAGKIHPNWWGVFLIPKLRAAKTTEEFAARIADNGETIQAYKKALTPAGAIAAAKELDDILKELAQ